MLQRSGIALPSVPADRSQALRQLLRAKGAMVGERTLAEILRALYTPDAVEQDVVAEVRAASLNGDKVTVVITAVELRDAIRRWS